MISIPAGTRVLLATRPVDFRNYGECRIMRSLCWRMQVYIIDFNDVTLIDQAF
jgi:hypothetical protein